MRIAALALTIVALAACKDKPAAESQHEPTRAATKPTAPTLELPEVTGPGTIKLTDVGPTITISKTDLAVDGTTVFELTPGGILDRTQLPRLTMLLETKVNSDAPIGLRLDASTRYVTIADLVEILKQGGFRRVALLGSGATMVPLELLDAAQVNGGGLRPVVWVNRDQVTVWSASGQEGTKKTPLLVFKLGPQLDLSQLTHTLASVVERHWPDGKRAAEDRRIIVAFDVTQTAQVVIATLAAVRADGTHELFPDIFLSGGFR